MPHRPPGQCPRRHSAAAAGRAFALIDAAAENIAMRYRQVIFDFDGTLADSFPWFAGVFNEVADRYRFRRIKPDEIETLRTLEPRQLLKRLEVPIWKLPGIANYMRRRMAPDAGRINLFPGVDELLRTLSGRGADLAILTSNSEENVRRILGPDLAALVGRYECGASLLGKRPKLRRILRSGAFPRRQCILVGDEARDIEAARGEGIAAGAVAWGFVRIETLMALGPEEVFSSVGEMLEKLT